MKIRETCVSKAGFTRLELLVTIVVLGVLIGFIVPAFTIVVERPRQAENLSKARQIYMALMLYAGDNDERFPDAKTSSNEAFQKLYPDYISNKEVFYFHHSAWTPGAPTEASLSNTALEAGENHFAYVSGLNSQSNPEFPLVADGFAEGKPGTYAPASKAKGGARIGRNGLYAVVIRVGGSGKFEKVRLSDYRVYGTIGDGNKQQDLFAAAPGWLSPDQVPLNPALLSGSVR